ncbi:MAG TPA: hypothetical protein VK586_19355, partial [Streptosporangiaceae bacterium]|nr:hypothetical protein [Streptosporangiaceae bacterium]
MSAGDSLILADMVELLKGGQVSAHPMCPGAQMILAPGFDRGAGQPQTDLIASLMTDGETPRGRRTGNRTCTLRVKIIGTSRANLSGAKELLLALVDQPKFSLTWTPDPQGGTPLPMVLDCFRTTGSTVDQDQNSEDNLVTYVTLVFPAHPFGRSADFMTIPFPGPSVSFAVPPAPVRLDDLTVVSSSTQPSVWSQSSQHVSDSFSARWTFASSGGATAPLYTRTLGAPVDLTGLTKLSFTFGMGTGTYLTWRAGAVTFAATLTDGSGHVLKFGGQFQLQASNDPAFPNWNQVTLAIPPSAVFDFTHVTGYSIQAWRQIHWLGFLFHDSDCYLNGITATAAALAPVPTTRGVMYQIGAPGGTARAPMFAEWTAPPPVTALTTTQVFSAAGAGRFIPPVFVKTLAVGVQAGAGKGGDRTTSGFGGGGGGGASVVHPAYPCTPGQGIDYFVGAGGTAGAVPALAGSYYAEQDTWTGNSLVTPSFIPAAGEVLVVKAIASDSVASFPSAPSGGGLTWTSRVSSGVSGFCRAQIWTATVGAGGSPMTVTLAAPSAFFYGSPAAMTVERWAGAVLAGSPATGSGTGSGTAPNVTVTTAAALSVVSYVNSDRNALAAGTRTYRTASTEENYNFDSGYYTGEWAYQAAASAGAQAIGMTAPASQQWACAGIEIQAAAAGGLTDGQASTFGGLGPAAAF